MKRITFLVLSLLIAMSMILAACKPAVVKTEEPVVEEPVVEEPTKEPVVEEPVVEEPTEEPEVRTTRKGGWLDEIVVSVVDNSSAITQIQAGAIDIYAAGMSSDSLPEIEAAGLDYAQSNGLYYELTFNFYGPKFDQSTGKVNPFYSAKAREAMNWLVDRDYINREVYNGGALAKFWSIITNMPDYTKMAETVRRLEAKYAYDPAKADAQIEEVMLGIEGVTRVDGKYVFDGEPVKLIMIIRNDSDKTRIPIGDYVANQLETIGFEVDRQYKRSSEASPIWVSGNVADGLWHIYTGAWSATIIDRDEGDNFEFFDTPQSAYGFSSTWQAMPYPIGTPYGDLADKLAYNKFLTIEERDAAMAEMLEMALMESVHVWLIDGKNFTPYRQGLDVTYDLAAGVDGSMIWPYTIRLTDQEGGKIKWGQPDLFVDPWNPLAGSNWAFDQAIGRATWADAYMIDPHTGLLWPQRFERAEIVIQEGLPVGKTLDWVDLSFEPEIVVPDDSIADWDTVGQKFITAKEKIQLLADAAAAAIPDAQVALDAAQAAFDGLSATATEEEKAAAQTALDEAKADFDDLTERAAFTGPWTARVKSTVYYPADLFKTVKWHDGSPLDLGDFIFGWIISLDLGKEGSPIYDESYAPNTEAILANYKGFRILSENPLTIEAYSDSYQTDAELDITTMWPSFSYGEAPWHVLTAGWLADVAGQVAWSPDAADARSTETASVEWLSFIGGPSLGFMSEQFDIMLADKIIPYAGVLSAYITEAEAAVRVENAKTFFAKYGHYNIGTGPYILDEVYLTEKVATLIHNPDHADLADKWRQFGDPKVAEIELEGEASVVLGSEIVFDVYVTFEGEAYPADEIKEVKGLLYDSTGMIVKVLVGELVEDGYYTITVPADVSAAMEAGASKLEAVVVPFTVAIPSFTALEFVTVK